LPPVHPIHSESRSRRDQRNQDIDAMMRKLDQMYNKLEEMNRSTPEQLTSEMLMFVSSGIFVLFLMDLLVKRGSSMRF
jgi:prefoldin subunit 5